MKAFTETEGLAGQIKFSMVHGHIDSLVEALSIQPSDLGEDYHRLTAREDLSELDWKAKATIV